MVLLFEIDGQVWAAPRLEAFGSPSPSLREVAHAGLEMAEAEMVAGIGRNLSFLPRKLQTLHLDVQLEGLVSETLALASVGDLRGGLVVMFDRSGCVSGRRRAGSRAHRVRLPSL